MVVLFVFAGASGWIHSLVRSSRHGERIESADPWDLKRTGQFSREE